MAKKMISFSQALATAGVDVQYRDVGLQALEQSHRKLIKPKDPRRLQSSVNLDAALKVSFPNENRWDYGVSSLKPDDDMEAVYWVEIHPANTKEVDVVLKKLDALKKWLLQHKEINELTTRAAKPFHWLATESGTHIVERSPQARKLRERGLSLPSRELRLP